jgi:predicted MPP superfamily phosphohydrolase
MHKLLTGSLSVETVTVEIQGLPENLQQTRIVQLSDFHYDGKRLSKELLGEAIARSNEQEPDLVVLTGDYVTDDPSPIHDLVMDLKHLESRAGIVAVLGNHDYFTVGSAIEIAAALRRVGIHVLMNEIAYPLGSGLPIVGLTDFWSSEFAPEAIMDNLDPTIPRIVLSHNPDSAALLRQWRVDLQFSGHTHGGQIVVPGVGPLLAWADRARPYIPRLVRRWLPYLRKEFYSIIYNWEWSEGLHQVGDNRLYVNRGLGTYFPGRLYCPPEVTVITLVKADFNGWVG